MERQRFIESIVEIKKNPESAYDLSDDEQEPDDESDDLDGTDAGKDSESDEEP